MSQAPGSPAAPARTPARTVDLIVVHCSATPSGKALGTGLGSRRRTAAQIIDGWHMQRGFARRPEAVAAHNPELPHLGYHFVIDVDGLLQQGRNLAEAGAHVKGHNANSVGVCLVGGAEPEGRYTVAQWATLKAVVMRLRQQFPAARVVGHRDLSPDLNADGAVQPREWLKTCPGFDVQAWLASDCQPARSQIAPRPGTPPQPAGATA